MSIFNMFARSPLGPLQTHMDKVYQCVKRLMPFFEAVFLEKWEEAQILQREISELERDADVIKRDLRLNLPNSFLMPVSRTDVLELCEAQDKVANKSKDIAGIIFGRKMVIPKPMVDHFKAYMESSRLAVEQANKAINELDKLLEAGFQGAEAEFVKAMISKLDALEHKSDELQIEVRQIVFSLEAELNPVDVIFLYRIIDGVGDLADRAQNVGGHLLLMLAR